MTNMELRVLRLPHGADLPLPTYQSAHAAGLDLMAAVPAHAPATLAPGVRRQPTTQALDALFASMGGPHA